MLNAVGHAQINSATPAAARGIAFAPAQAQEIERFDQSVIRAETAALESLGDRTDGSFVDACRYLLRCRGRIVVVGTGKSGHIARKIAATLASTGSPAFYVHPAEACHGDLGMLELPKRKADRLKQLTSALADWIALFRHLQEEDIMAHIANGPVRTAFDRLKTLSNDDEARRLAFVRERALLDERSLLKGAHDEGWEQGIEKASHKANSKAQSELCARPPQI